MSIAVHRRPRLPAAALMLAMAIAADGCTMLGTGIAKHDNAARLMQHPDYPPAASAAPEWCRDALKTINALEYELERK